MALSPHRETSMKMLTRIVVAFTAVLSTASTVLAQRDTAAVVRKDSAAVESRAGLVVSTSAPAQSSW